MKYRHKNHEFDIEAKEVIDIIEAKDSMFAIFGAGKIAAGFLSYIEKIGNVECFLDNRANEFVDGYLGKKVYSPEQFDLFESTNKGFIIIAASVNSSKQIEQQLIRNGYVAERDFCLAEQFVRKVAPIYMAYSFNKYFMELAQICITERCTLKCKKCAHGCYAVPNNADDMEFEEVKRNADAFFGVVDYIQEFVLIGGEPLLNKDIADCIDYIGTNYRDHINIFSITTNGTIIPSERLLEKCREHKVLFRISNYSSAIPKLKEQYKKLTGILERNNIGYAIQKEDNNWYDYGFDYVNDDLSEDKFIERFDKCGTPCRDIHDQKLYYCVMARSVSENLNYGIGKDDYLDLTTLTEKNRSRVLLEYNMGYSEKGYLDMCARCHGKDAINHIIPAAEQIERN